jgi:hypothetical protein
VQLGGNLLKNSKHENCKICKTRQKKEKSNSNVLLSNLCLQNDPNLFLCFFTNCNSLYYFKIKAATTKPKTINQLTRDNEWTIAQTIP